MGEGKEERINRNKVGVKMGKKTCYFVGRGAREETCKCREWMTVKNHSTTPSRIQRKWKERNIV